MRRVRIGSRGSRLALWQAEHVAALLRHRYPELQVEIDVIQTKGDKILDAPLSRIGGKGLFTKEIEDALLRDSIDLAVHSLKDLPTRLPAGLALGAVLSRHDPSDALVSPSGTIFSQLPQGARIGTSSLRRQAQILHRRPDLEIVTIRGNVQTRIRKTTEEKLDGTILALAGLERLGLKKEITEVLPFDLLLPAPGQGALGIEIRDADEPIASVLGSLEDRSTRAETDAERSFLESLGGGCQVPIGALARRGEDQTLRLAGVVADPSGTTLLRGERSGSPADAQRIGRALAEELIDRGADRILAQLLGPDGGAEASR